MSFQGLPIYSILSTCIVEKLPMMVPTKTELSAPSKEVSKSIECQFLKNLNSQTLSMECSKVNLYYFVVVKQV